MRHNDYEIMTTSEGFSAPVLFGNEGHGSMYQIMTFVVTKNDEAYSFLFGASTVEASLHSISLSKDTEVIDKAVDTVKMRLDEGYLVNGEKYFFQLNLDAANIEYSPIVNPIWSDLNYR